MITDVHFHASRKSEYGRHYQLALKKLNQIVDHINANYSKIDLLVDIGDLVDSDPARNTQKPLAVLDRLADIEKVHLLGNHDYGCVAPSEIDQLHALYYKMSSRYSSKIVNNDRLKLIFLDSNDISTYGATGSKKQTAVEEIAKLERAKQNNARDYNGGIGTQQLAWLKQELHESCIENHSHQRVLIFLHDALLPIGNAMLLFNSQDVLDLIASFDNCVLSVFSGHVHDFHEGQQLTRSDPIPVLTLGGIVQSPFQSYGFCDVYHHHEDPTMTTLHVHGLDFGHQIDLTYSSRYRYLGGGGVDGVEKEENLSERRLNLRIDTTTPFDDGFQFDTVIPNVVTILAILILLRSLKRYVKKKMFLCFPSYTSSFYFIPIKTLNRKKVVSNELIEKL